MKFSCGECQAKYQIPDERVAGRKLKIRCRKCGAAISLRGDPTVEGYVGMPLARASVEWHVSIDGEQHGPYATEQMASMLRGGQLGWEAYVWREGFGDWKTADESDTLVRAVSALSSAAPTSGIAPYEDDDVPTRMKAAPEEQEEPTLMAVNASPLMGQGVQQQPLQPQARTAFAARAATVRAYGSAPPGVYASSPPAVMMPPPAAANVRQLPVSRSPRVSAAQAMTAERHEDSVLFSANNIVASSEPAPSPRAGYANAEGSGPIDIRALAALAHSNRSPVAQRPTATELYTSRAEEPLPAIAHQAGTFSRIDSLSPFDRPATRSSNAVPIAIIAGSAMIAAAAFLAVYLTQQPIATAPTVVAPAEQPAAAAQPTATAEQPLPTAAEPGAAEPAVPTEAVVAAAEPEAAEPADEPAARQEATPRGRAGKKSLARGAVRSAKLAVAPKAEKASKADKASSSAKAAEPEPAAEKEKPSIDDLLLGDPKPAPVAAAEPAKPKEPPKSRSIDDLLETAVDKKDKAGGAAAAPAAASSLPETPGRDDVKTAMAGIADAVKACADGQNLTDPTATVALTVIGATGRVQSVRVTGNQGAVGTCIARAVRGAAFPKFSKPQITINFPFKLK